jgi:hypothetical protein
MRTIMVVVAHELREQGEQMPFVHHDDVVKALLAKGPHYPFASRPKGFDPGCADAALACDEEHLELVSQDQILERKILAGTTAIKKDAQQHQEEAQHRRGGISGQGAPRCARS